MEPRIDFKHGVQVNDVWPVMFRAIADVAEVYAEYGYQTVVTSISDGQHSANSFHYRGRAVDFRTKHLEGGSMGPLARQVFNKIREKLGDKDFDFVMHKTHIHIEYDPK